MQWPRLGLEVWTVCMLLRALNLEAGLADYISRVQVRRSQVTHARLPTRLALTRGCLDRERASVCLEPLTQAHQPGGTYARLPRQGAGFMCVWSHSRKAANPAALTRGSLDRERASTAVALRSELPEVHGLQEHVRQVAVRLRQAELHGALGHAVDAEEDPVPLRALRELQ